MEYSIEYDPAACMLTARVQGAWSWIAAFDAGRSLREAVAARHARSVLIDLREVVGLDLRTLSMYELASRLVAGRRRFAHIAAKGAFVVPDLGPEGDVHYQYFENTSRNRGLPYRLFKDVEQARQWLRGG